MNFEKRHPKYACFSQEQMEWKLRRRLARFERLASDPNKVPSLVAEERRMIAALGIDTPAEDLAKQLAGEPLYRQIQGEHAEREELDRVDRLGGYLAGLMRGAVYRPGLPETRFLTLEALEQDFTDQARWQALLPLMVIAAEVLGQQSQLAGIYARSKGKMMMAPCSLLSAATLVPLAALTLNGRVAGPLAGRMVSEGTDEGAAGEVAIQIRLRQLLGECGRNNVPQGAIPEAAALTMARAAVMALEREFAPAFMPLETLAEFTRLLDPALGFELYQVGAWQHFGPTGARLFLARAWGPDRVKALHNDHSFEVVLWALYSALKECSVGEALNRASYATGNDASSATVCAMAGALRGAEVGLFEQREELPAELLCEIESIGSALAGIVKGAGWPCPEACGDTMGV